MGEVRKPKPVKLFIGLLTAHLSLLPDIHSSLEQKFGPIELTSGLLNFDFTTYYEPELGSGLKRQFLGFHNLVAPETLPEIKLSTNELENAWKAEGKRLVNLDPGYVASARVVLASTKDFAHRLYLGQGIYGEVTLLFRQGKFDPLPWTYPDYRSESYHQFFYELRRRYSAQLKTVSE